LQQLIFLESELLEVIVDQLGNVGGVQSGKDCRMLHCKTFADFAVKTESLVKAFQGHEIQTYLKENVTAIRVSFLILYNPAKISKDPLNKA